MGDLEDVEGNTDLRLGGWCLLWCYESYWYVIISLCGKFQISMKQNDSEYKIIQIQITQKKSDSDCNWVRIENDSGMQNDSE